ncbi:sulfatase [Microbacterium insulae]|uniref:Sulfatase n=1 Tax=Microbacterium insulae TaxID=483014 RepID=A0ABW3AHV2_9MICO
MSTEAKRPNVIWILVDQFRGQSLSLMRDPNVRTPHLDRLAYEGCHFPRALSGTPLCTPARGSFLTGRYPHASTAPTHDSPMDETVPTIATVLGEEGYDTCYIGKWHLDGRERASTDAAHEEEARTRFIPPERRGDFGSWFGFEYSNRPFDTIVNVDTPDGPGLRELPGFQSDVLTDLLIDWLAARGAEAGPFFAVLSIEPPHSPYLAPADAMARHHPDDIVFRGNVPESAEVRDQAARELAGYYAAIEQVDEGVGRLRAALADLGIADETYLMFFSDHGDMHGSHGQFRKTAPWEEAIRIPFIVGGARSRDHQELSYAAIDSLVNHVDVAPTTLGLCGVDTPDWMQGHDYSGRILEEHWHSIEAPPGEPVDAYLSLPIPTLHEHSVDRAYRGIVTKDDWKYVCLEGQPWLMFDLTSDPLEQVNLAHNTRYASKRAELHRALRVLIERTGDTFGLPELD